MCVHGSQKIELAQNIHASRGRCEMHEPILVDVANLVFGDFACLHKQWPNFLFELWTNSAV